VKDPLSDVSPPDLPLANDVVVKMVVGLKMSILEFDSTKQLIFRQSTANAAAVAVGKVRITNVKVQTTGRRHLLADGIRIDVEIAVKDANAAASVLNQLSVENINIQLSKSGLPEAEVLSASVVSSAPASPAESESRSNDMKIIIAALCAGIGVVMLGVAVCMYRRRRTRTDLETERVFLSRATNDLDTDTSGESHMTRLVNNLSAAKESITDVKSTLGAADDEQAHIGRYQPVDTQEVNLDSVVMNVLENVPAAVLSSQPETVPVRAYELIDVTTTVDQIKNSIAQQISNLNLDANKAVRVTADHGFLAQHIEESSVMPSVSSRIPSNTTSNTTCAASPAPLCGSIAILPSLTARVTLQTASSVLSGPDKEAPRPSDEVYNQPSKPTTRKVCVESAGRMRVMAAMNSLMPPEESSEEDEDQDAMT